VVRRSLSLRGPTRLTLTRDKRPWDATDRRTHSCSVRNGQGEIRSNDGGPTTVVPDAVLSLVLDHTVDGILLVSDGGVIVYANRALHQLLGYDAGSLIGRSLETLIPEDLRDRHRRAVARFHRKPTARPMGRADLDIEGRRADGSTVAVDVQLEALPGLPFMVATVRDMTAERRSSVDRAIDKLDLAGARMQVDRLQSALDQVIQRLFALGASIEAGAANESDLSARLNTALKHIDQIIEAVQKDIGGRVVQICQYVRPMLTDDNQVR
jgi:PAS domain S-box-containing protein